jgi:hypothetical protein
MDPGVELKHNTVNGANGGLILPLLSCTGLDWPAAQILLHATSASSVVKVLCIFICCCFCLAKENVSFDWWPISPGFLRKRRGEVLGKDSVPEMRPVRHDGFVL